MFVNPICLKMKYRSRNLWLFLVLSAIAFIFITWLTFPTVKRRATRMNNLAVDNMSTTRFTQEKVSSKFQSNVKAASDNELFQKFFDNITIPTTRRPRTNEGEIFFKSSIGRTKVHNDVSDVQNVANVNFNNVSVKNVKVNNVKVNNVKVNGVNVTKDVQSPGDTIRTETPVSKTSALRNSTEMLQTEAVNKQRVSHLRKTCENYAITGLKNPAGSPVGHNLSIHLPHKTLDDNFFVDEKRQLVMCAVEKVGSSFWKRAFRILNRLAPPGSVFNQSGLSTHVINRRLTFRDKNARWKSDTLQNSHKVLFVRHPFARTFSAYLDKIFIPNTVRLPKRFNNTDSQASSTRNQTDPRRRCELNIQTFSEFIDESFSKSKPGVLFSRNPHFTPVHRHCQPCRVQFDLVGQMETFRQDTALVLHKAGLSLEDVVDDPKTLDARSDLSIMSDIVLRTLTSQAWRELGEGGCLAGREEVLQRVWTVFKARGLISSRLPFPVKVSAQSDNATLTAVLLAVKKAYDASDSKSQRVVQRDAAMVEAFRSLSSESWTKLTAFHKTDCDLFGYNCTRHFLVQPERKIDSSVDFFKQWL